MNQWFTEEEDNSIRYSYAVTQRLFKEKSEFQEVEVIDTIANGRMLIIDGFVMLSERDEFVYHEMISHIPVSLHSAPRKIGVIGGGDGGTLRELLKHDIVEHVVLCEIDAMVVDVSKKYFPQVAAQLDSPKVDVKIGDGIAYMHTLDKEFDVIIIDSTDPIGPGEGLFTGEFYKSVARALKPGGIMVAQSESPWANSSMISKIHENLSEGFKFIKPYIGSIPTYPRGLWSWSLASQSEIIPSKLRGSRIEQVSPNLQYLSSDLAVAAFSLPKFYQDKLVYAK